MTIELINPPGGPQRQGMQSRGDVEPPSVVGVDVLDDLQDHATLVQRLGGPPWPSIADSDIGRRRW
jgi:hypothetical protein